MRSGDENILSTSFDFVGWRVRFSHNISINLESRKSAPLTIDKATEKRLDSVEMWLYRRIVKISYIE